MPAAEEVLATNADYPSRFGDEGELPPTAGRHFAILTCSDARLDPARYEGLAEGDAHVVHSVGGRVTDDAIHSLVISHTLLGADEWFVIHHTDREASVREDVAKLRSHPLVPASVAIYGYVYDVRSGWLFEVTDIDGTAAIPC